MSKTSDTEPGPAVAFCPFCGDALGSFFGNRTVTGARTCDRCQECFRVERVNDDEA